MNYFEKFCLICSTLGPIGYLPASGTVATIVTMLFLWGAAWLGLSSFYLFHSIVALVGISVFIVHGALFHFSCDDPSAIVLDEVVGYLFAVSIFPLTWPWMIGVALVFRFFDILKPLGIKKIEALGGAAGIISDDLLAGFYTWIVIVLGCIGYDIWFR